MCQYNANTTSANGLLSVCAQCSQLGSTDCESCYWIPGNDDKQPTKYQGPSFGPKKAMALRLPIQAHGFMKKYKGRKHIFCDLPFPEPIPERIALPAPKPDHQVLSMRGAGKRYSNRHKTENNAKHPGYFVGIWRLILTKINGRRKS